MVIDAVAARWDRWWHAQASPAALALFRLAFAYTLWREIKSTFGYSRAALAGPGFHLPYVSFLSPLEWDAYELLHALQYPLVALFALGVVPRLAAAGLLVCQSWVFFTDQLTFRNHPYFFMLVILVLLPSPAWEALSVKALLGGWRRREPWRTRLLGPPSSLAFQRLVVAQVCLVYVYSALHKLHGLYLDGGVLQRILSRHLRTGDSGRWLSRHFAEADVAAFLARPEMWKVLAPAVVALELVLPVLLLWRRSRPLAVVAGVGFHLTVMLTMGIHVFSYAMIATYLLFLDPATVPRWFDSLSRLLGRRTDASGAVAPAPPAPPAVADGLAMEAPR